MVSSVTQRWSFDRLLSLFLLAIATPSYGWSPSLLVSHRRGHGRLIRSTATNSPLFGQQQQQQQVQLSRRRISFSPLFSAEQEESSSEETEAMSTSNEVTNNSSSEEEEEKLGVVRTILLAGPLFIKFTIVLLIKFVTDLIVFPLLWLYRLARLTKRKFLKMIGKGDREYPNGEPRP